MSQTSNTLKTNLSQLKSELSKLSDWPQNSNISDQILIDVIKNKIQNLEINPAEADQIDLSLKNGLLNQLLAVKQEKFKNHRNLSANYLRMDLIADQNFPFQALLEIWPENHFSPIHAHGGSIGIIKILKGNLVIKLFESLENPILTQELFFNPGDITHLTSNQNHVHQLIQPGNGFTATVQIYCRAQSEQFEYLDAQKNINRIIPLPDLNYFDLF